MTSLYRVTNICMEVSMLTSEPQPVQEVES